MINFLDFAAKSATMTDVIVLSIIATGFFVAGLVFTVLSVQYAFAKSTAEQEDIEIAID